MSDPSVIFVYLLLFTINSIAFCFMISTFFSKGGQMRRSADFSKKAHATLSSSVPLWLQRLDADSTETFADTYLEASNINMHIRQLVTTEI